MAAVAYEVDGATRLADSCLATATAGGRLRPADDDTAAGGVAESNAEGKERGEGEGRSSPEEGS